LERTGCTSRRPSARELQVLDVPGVNDVEAAVALHDPRGLLARFAALTKVHDDLLQAVGVKTGKPDKLAIRRPGRLMFAFEVLACVSTLAIGLIPSVPAVVLLMALVGVGLASSTVIWEALLQRHVPERMLGRVSSIDLLGNSLINPIGPIAMAALVASIGPASTFVVAGSYALALASLWLLASPLRHIDESRS